MRVLPDEGRFPDPGLWFSDPWLLALALLASKDLMMSKSSLVIGLLNGLAVVWDFFTGCFGLVEAPFSTVTFTNGAVLRGGACVNIASGSLVSSLDRDDWLAFMELVVGLLSVPKSWDYYVAIIIIILFFTQSAECTNLILFRALF